MRLLIALLLLTGLTACDKQGVGFTYGAGGKYYDPETAAPA